MSKSELFPESDKLGNVERQSDVSPDTSFRSVNTVVAYDYDGARFCVDCAKEHTEIDRQKWRQDPRSVPYGGATCLCHMQDTNVTYYCDNPNCGRQIPETRDEV